MRRVEILFRRRYGLLSRIEALMSPLAAHRPDTALDPPYRSRRRKYRILSSQGERVVRRRAAESLLGKEKPLPF